MANKLETIYHNLSIMFEAGVPILKALRTAGAAGKSRWQRAFNRLADHAAEGDALADAMSKDPRRFVPLDVQLVRVGEESGNLPLMLRELSGWYALCNRLNRQIRSGLTLPVMIFHFAAIFVPGMDYLTSELTGGNMTLNDMYWDIIHFLSFMYVPAGIILFIINCTPKTGPLRWLMDLITLQIPFIGYAFKQLALSRFCQNFHLCYSAGVPMLRTCQVAIDSTGNAIVANWFKPAIEVIREGKQVSDGLPVHHLSAEFIASWQNGEEAGKLDFATAKLAQHATEKAENMFQQIAAWLPRIVYGLVSLFIIKMIFKIAANAFSGIGAALA